MGANYVHFKTIFNPKQRLNYKLYNKLNLEYIKTNLTLKRNKTIYLANRFIYFYVEKLDLIKKFKIREITGRENELKNCSAFPTIPILLIKEI